MRACIALLFAGLAACGGRVPPPTAPAADPAGPLYRASLAAAELSLRLHETDRARSWLEEAPAAERGWEWRHLNALIDQSVAQFALDSGVITDIAPHPDGRLLAVATAGGAVLLVDAATGGIVRRLEGHTASAWSPVFTADGSRLATASSDGSARIWDVATGQSVHVLPDNGRGVAAIAWAPGEREVAVGSWDRTPERGVWGTLNVWNAATGERVRHLEFGGYPIGSLTWSKDGAQLIGGTWDWNLLLWDTRTWQDPVVLPPPESPDYKRINDFDLAADGSRLAVAYADGRARVWDLAQRRVVQTFYAPVEGQLKSLNDVVFLPGGGVATVADDLTLRVWDSTGVQLATLHGHDRPINTVAVSTDGRRLFTGGAEGVLRVWDLVTLDPVRVTWRVPHTVYSADFGPRHEQVVLATWEGWIRVLDTATGRELRSWQGHRQAAVAADWSPDGRWIASTGNDGRVVLWDASGRQIRELQKVDRQLVSIAFSPDGSLLAAPGARGEVKLWRMPAGEPAATLAAGDSLVVTVAWHGTDRLAASATDGKVRIWDVKSGALRTVIDAGTGAPAIAWHPSGTELMVARGRSVRVWSLETGAWTQELLRPVSVQRVAYSHDGERVAAALSGNSFEIWSARTGDVLLRLPQAAQAWAVDWTDRSELVLIPLDQTVRLLRAPPPKP